MELHTSIDLIFRREYSKIVAYLTNKYSPHYIDFIEDAVQEALLKAMMLWPFHAMPENPSGWLYRVANNHLIDQLRRNQKTVPFEIPESALSTDGKVPEMAETELPDERLKMIFACCHPSLQEVEQIMLSLKLLCGLSVKEIAAALIKKEDAVKKAITRGKKKFQTRIGALTVPEGNELRSRLDVVLKVIYLLFNEGYKSTEGQHLIRKDICEEAIRLAGILHENRYCNTPDLNGLLALMCFSAARFDARVNSDGELLTLEHQDRSLWDRNYINLATYFLAESAAGNHLSQYHLEAAIAGHHSTAENFQATDWEAILFIYDQLATLEGTPIVALNRLVVLEKVNGPGEALKELEALNIDGKLKSNYLFHSIKADFQIALGNIAEGIQSLKTAIWLASNSIEIRFLERKLQSLDR